MAVTKTPRKKTDASEAPKAVKAPVKKATPVKPVKSAPEKPAMEKAATKKPVAKKAAPKLAEPARKPKAAAAPEPAAATQEKQEPQASPKVAGKSVPPTTGPSPFVEAILAAIREGRALEFIFADGDGNAPRTFEPRQLTFDALSQAWYVWGWDRRYNAERFHRLDLLGEVNPVEGVGRAAQGPYAEGTPANQIGGWLGGEPIPVKATLMKQWVFAVKQAPPAFPNFRLEEQGDGQALVTFSATDLRAIARWIMQFGDGVQVLEPARLQDRIKQVGAVWMGRERQSAAAPASRHDSVRHEPRSETRSEPKAESKPAPRPEPPQESRRRDSRPPREPRPEREARPREQEDDAPKAKPGKLEVIRFDRL